jgi:hypothetical protein
VPVWYVAPLEMNEGTHWGQGYNRSIRLQCRRRPNKATFNLYGRDCHNTVDISRQTCAYAEVLLKTQPLTPCCHLTARDELHFSVHMYGEIKETKFWKPYLCPSVTMLDTPAYYFRHPNPCHAAVCHPYGQSYFALTCVNSTPWHYISSFRRGGITSDLVRGDVAAGKCMRALSTSELLVGGLFETERERQLKKKVLTVKVRPHLTANCN